MANITTYYWNTIQELLKRLNEFEKEQASHITKVLPDGTIYYEFNPNVITIIGKD